MSQAKYGQADQIGYLVADLDKSIAGWIETMGVGPWTVFRNVSLNGAYRGVEGVVTMDVGLAYQGDIQIELIQVTNDTPSPYRKADGEAILGIHHLAWMVDDVESAVARASADGLSTVFTATNPASSVAYMERPGEPGLLFEFIESPATREMMNAGIVASKKWDGSNPVHVIDFAAG